MLILFRPSTQVQQGFSNLCHADSPEMHPGHIGWRTCTWQSRHESTRQGESFPWKLADARQDLLKIVQMLDKDGSGTFVPSLAGGACSQHRGLFAPPPPPGMTNWWRESFKGPIGWLMFSSTCAATLHASGR